MYEIIILTPFSLAMQRILFEDLMDGRFVDVEPALSCQQENLLVVIALEEVEDAHQIVARIAAMSAETVVTLHVIAVAAMAEEEVVEVAVAGKYTVFSWFFQDTFSYNEREKARWHRLER
jgi:hypothetical protein